MFDKFVPILYGVENTQPVVWRKIGISEQAKQLTCSSSKLSCDLPSSIAGGRCRLGYMGASHIDLIVYHDFRQLGTFVCPKLNYDLVDNIFPVLSRGF